MGIYDSAAWNEGVRGLAGKDPRTRSAGRGQLAMKGYTAQGDKQQLECLFPWKMNKWNP